MPRVPVDSEQRRAEIHRAEAALWNYYREWSQIAQAVIKDERLLKRLGYRDEESPDEESVAPAKDVGEIGAILEKKSAKRRTVPRERRKMSRPRNRGAQLRTTR